MCSDTPAAHDYYISPLKGLTASADSPGSDSPEWSQALLFDK